MSFHYRDGMLHAEAVALDAIAKTVGTPAYVYSAETLLDAARQFRAALAGVPDKRWGESLAAFVVRAEGSRISEADIVAHCARELGGYKKPHAVRFVDDLGRSASGKVSREQLEELKGLL